VLEISTGLRPPQGKVIAAFASVYLIWGSTYLAIRFAIETMPPHLMAAARFLVAGAILYAWARLRGAPGPPVATGARRRSSAVSCYSAATARSSGRRRGCPPA